MKWETVKSTAEQEIYHLYKDNKHRLTLTFNPFSSSARIECNKEKRIFLIRKEGFRRNRTVIRNEYGIKIGEFGQEGRQHFIAINGEKFYYSTRNNPLAELLLFKESDEQPVVACALTGKEGSAGVHFRKDKNLSGQPHPGLLMALCWYMFLPVTRENILDPAAASLSL